jgi:hypothetical protein
LFFLLFSTVRYYYAGLVCMPLMLHGTGDRLVGKVLMAYLLLANAGAFFLKGHMAFCFLYNTYFTVVLSGYVVAIVVVAEVRRRGRGAEALEGLLT